MKYLNYSWLHIPTGNSGIKPFRDVDILEVNVLNIFEPIIEDDKTGLPELAALRLLNRWNRVGRGQWLYWLD